MGAGLCLALVSLVLASGMARGSVSAQPTASARRVAFWGSFAGSNSRHLSPVTVTLPAPVAEVGTSNSTVYALLTDGSVYAWGTGTRGQLGDGRSANSFTTPVRVKFPAGVKIASMAVNSDPWDTAFAIDTTGHAWGWGANGSGDLCLSGLVFVMIDVAAERGGQILIVALVGKVEGGLRGRDGLGILAGL